MRRVGGFTILWLGLALLNLNVGGVIGAYQNVPGEEDELLQTSGHYDAFKDGQLAGVLGGLLQQRPDTVMRSMSTLSDPDRILCLFNQGSKGNKHEGHGGQEGGHSGHKHQQQGNNQQQYGVQQQQDNTAEVYGIGIPQPQQNQAYGVSQQSLNQNYGPPPPQNQNLAYGVPTQNQGYGPPQNQNQYGAAPSQMQNQFQGQGRPPQKQHKPPPQKSYSFSISFGDRIRPRKKHRPQKPFNRPPHPPPPQYSQHPPTPSIEMQPVAPPSSYQPVSQPPQPQQPIFYQPLPQPAPQQSFTYNMQPQPQLQMQQPYQNPQQIFNLPLPPTNIQPLLPTSFQSPPQQTNYQPSPPSTNYFSQSTFTPSQQLNSQYGEQPSFTPMTPVTQPQPQPQFNYGFNPIDKVNYKPDPHPQYQPQPVYQEPQQDYQNGLNYNGNGIENDISGNGKSFVFVYGPPENEKGLFDSPPPPVVTRVPQSPEKQYQIVFIKAPAPPLPPQMEIQLPAPPEHKTLVYVLVKKPSPASEIKFRKPPTTKPSPPEVFFIKYKNNGGGGVGSGSGVSLPSTSDPNAETYATIKTTNNFQNEENYDFMTNQGNDIGVGDYGESFQSRSNLPSTSSDFAMGMASRRSDISDSETQSHYTAPGSLPWEGGDAEESE